jgi:hypothetical protein
METIAAIGLASLKKCCSCPQSSSPKFTNFWAKYPTKFSMARKYGTFPSLLLVHTEKSVVLYPSNILSWNLKTGDCMVRLELAAFQIMIYFVYSGK